MSGHDYTAAAWILGGLVLLWVLNTWLNLYRPDRRRLLEEYEAIKERATTERSIAADAAKIFSQEDRRRAEAAAEKLESTLAYMRRTGRLPPNA